MEYFGCAPTKPKHLFGGARQRAGRARLFSAGHTGNAASGNTYVLSSNPDQPLPVSIDNRNDQAQT